MTNRLFSSLLLLAGALLADVSLAQAVSAPAGPITSTLVARRVELVDGRQVLVPADAVKPGDTVEYASTYRNTSNRPVDKLVANVPVPANTTFVAGSADPAQALASTDGTRYATLPLTRQVRAADGSTRQQAVPLSEYRFVRWEVGTLAPGAEVTLRMRVRVDAPAPASATPATRP